MGSMKDLFGDQPYDATQSRSARDAGIGLVQSHNAGWLEKVMSLIQMLPQGWCGTGEDIRRITAPAAGQPKHHNAWGAVVNVAIRRKLLVKTGRRLRMRFVRSHARMTDEYRRT